MKLFAAWQKVRRKAGATDALRVNTVNNPAYTSTVVDPGSGRRSLMGTGRKSVCAILRDSPLEPGAPRTAVVLGIARGGTSMVSGVLRGLGVDMGENLGFNHEDTQIQRIVNKQRFGAIGPLARKRDEMHDLWGFKFPEASLMMDRFHPELRNPHYLFVLRHPLARGMSVLKRTGGKLNEAVAESLESYRAILAFLEGVEAPAILINYEHATAQSRDSVAEIARFLGIEARSEAIERAAAMIVGEGAGYLNLPEFWFFAEEVGGSAAGLEPLAAEPGEPRIRELGYAKERASIWSAPPGGFPKTFRIGFKLAGGSTGDRIRLYYDYDDDRFHTGHRLLLEVKSKKPVFRVETTGELKRIAIVPVDDDARVRNVRFEAEPEAT
jgi:hypothetical protein